MSENAPDLGKQPGRVSVTVKPSTRELLGEMARETGVSKSDLFTIGVDVLHFVWSVVSRGGVVGVKFPNDETFNEVHVYIPGMTQPFSGR